MRKRNIIYKILINFLPLILICCLVIQANYSSIKAEDSHLTNKTFTTDIYGGEYSLAYILSHYNVWTFEDYKGTHVVGPMVVGGNAGRTTLNGSDSSGTLAVGGLSTTNTEEYPHLVPSYFKGQANISNVITASSVPLYLGTVNNSKAWQITGSNHIIYEDYYFTDDYIDSSIAKTKIIEDANLYKDFEGTDSSGNKIHKINISQDFINEIKTKISNNSGYIEETESYKIFKETSNNGNGLTVQLKLGNNYHFDSFQDITCIIYDYDDDPQDKTTIISTDDTEINLPRIFKTKSDEMGKTYGGQYLNNNNQLGYAYQFDSIESGKSISVMYLCLNATQIKIESGVQKLNGHLVAPLADIKIYSGDYNGSIIAKSVDSKAEGHMWQYSGISKLGNVDLEFHKLVNGEVIDSNQSFTFQISLVESPEGIDNNMIMQQATDENGNILFSFQDINVAGEYLMKVEEMNNEGYICTPQAIYVKFKIDSVQSNGNTTFKSTILGYYTDETCTVEYNDKTFNNIETIDLTVQKQWKDSHSQSINENDLLDYRKIKINLYQVVNHEEPKLIKENYILNQDNDWKVTFEDLPKVRESDYAKYQYYVEEESVKGYTTTYSLADHNSNDPKDIKTNDSSTITITNQKEKHILQFKKIDANDQTKVLKNANFELFNKDDLENPIKFKKDSQGYYRYNQEGTSTLITNDEGIIQIDLNSLWELNQKDYILIETQAPLGYAISFQKVDIHIDCEDECYYKIDDDIQNSMHDHEVHEIVLTNEIPIQMPETGVNFKHITMIGEILCIASITLFLSYKNKGGNKND